MKTRFWWAMIKLTAALSRGCCRIHLYRVCFWFSRWSMLFLDYWDGGYPEPEGGWQ